MLGPQCREHEVDLPGPHLGCCGGRKLTILSGEEGTGHPGAVCCHFQGQVPAGNKPKAGGWLLAGELLPLPQHRAGAGLQTVGDEHREAGPPAAVQASAGLAHPLPVSWGWFPIGL